MGKIWVALASAASLAGTTVSAQTAPPEQDTADDIVVTGEKVDRTLHDTPTSVAVTTPARIEREVLRSVQDVYQRTANVSETYGAAGFTIRGIANTGVGAGGNADTATVYVDGAPIPSVALFGGPTDLWDVDQVEILRGPQSTIQGLNALAGAVVIRTRDASTSDHGADARLWWNERQERSFSVALGGPVVADELGLRLSADRRADRGLIRNVTRGGFDDALRTLSLRGKLKWTPAAVPGLGLQASYQRARRDGGYLFNYARTDTPDFFRRRVATADAPSDGLVRSDIAVLDLDYAVAPGWRLSAVTSHSRIVTHAVADGDGGPLPAQVIDNINRLRTWTEEVRLNVERGRVSGVLGLWAYRRAGGLVAANRLTIATPLATITTLLQRNGFPATAAARLATAYVAALPSIPVAYDGTQSQLVRTAALFADARVRLTERLSLVAGGRYDHEANRFGAASLATFAGTRPREAAFGQPGAPAYQAVTALNRGVLALVASASAPAAAAARGFDAFLPKAGVSMAWTPDMTTTVTVQRAYRSGGSSQNPARAVLVAYRPEYSWNYEAALRSRWLGGRLTLNANLFYVDWTDQQTNVFFGSSAYDYNTVNAGRSHLYGGEVEVQARVGAGLDAYGSIGHVRTRFDSFILPAGTSATSDLAGSSFPYAPRWTTAGGLHAARRGWAADLNANYRSPVFTVTGVRQAQTRLPGRVVVNARIGFDPARWSVFLFARNLLDARYKHYDPAVDGRAILGDPRAIGLGAAMHL